MNKYQTLAGNTVKLGLGTFGSKILVFLIVRFYTEYLSPADYGAADLITQTANLLIPLISLGSLGITDAVFRFAMDEAEDAAEVFTAGGVVIAAHLQFYGSVWRTFVTGMVLSASSVIAFSRLAVRLLAEEEFFAAWQFVPALCLAMVFASFSTFLSSVYVVSKRSGLSFWEQRGAQSAAHSAHRRAGRGASACQPADVRPPRLCARRITEILPRSTKHAACELCRQRVFFFCILRAFIRGRI